MFLIIKTIINNYYEKEINSNVVIFSDILSIIMANKSYKVNSRQCETIWLDILMSTGARKRQVV